MLVSPNDIYVPDEVVSAITRSMTLEDTQAQTQREKQLASLKQRFSTIRTRMDQMYDDKLDGKIDEQFWSRKMAEFRTQEIELLAASERLTAAVNPERILSAQRILGTGGSVQMNVHPKSGPLGLARRPPFCLQ